MKNLDSIAGTVFLDDPGIDTLRADAMRSGGVDPIDLRFQVFEYRVESDEYLGTAVDDAGFPEAVEQTQALIRIRTASVFYLVPVGFVNCAEYPGKLVQ